MTLFRQTLPQMINKYVKLDGSLKEAEQDADNNSFVIKLQAELRAMSQAHRDRGYMSRPQAEKMLEVYTARIQRLLLRDSR